MAVNFYVAIPLMAILAIVQTAVLPHFPIAGVEPQLMFLFALAWGLVRGLEEGVVWAFIAGLWADLFSMTPIGLSALAFMAAVAVPVLLQQVMPPRRLLIAALMAGLGTIIYLVLTLIILGLLGHGVSAKGLAELLPLIALHMAVILPIFLLLQWIVRVSRPRRVEF